VLDLNRSGLGFSEMVEDDKGRREHNKALLLVLGHVMMILLNSIN
jgi:hypothetical protein